MYLIHNGYDLEDKVYWYARKLETYCDELEAKLKFVEEHLVPDYEQCQKELWETQKALDKVLELIASDLEEMCSFNGGCPYQFEDFGNIKCFHECENKEKLKEWVLK